jgi:hypothetical protein
MRSKFMRSIVVFSGDWKNNHKIGSLIFHEFKISIIFDNFAKDGNTKYLKLEIKGSVIEFKSIWVEFFQSKSDNVGLKLN